MKPIVMTKEAEEKMLTSFFEKFKKEWESFKTNMNDSKFTSSADMTDVAKEKINILYTQQAYLRMKALVDHYDTEVGWYGLVKKIDDHNYHVYDVKICKQYVNGSKVDTEDEDTLEFFDSLSDKEIEDMHFQAHSHVKMSTEASGVDLQNQADVIKNIGNTSFYLFQIWNKNGDINSYLYDLDNNVLYDRKDVNIYIADDAGTLNDFIAATKDLVVEKKYYPYQFTPTGKIKSKGKRKNDGPSYLPYYEDGFYYRGVYDY